MAQPVFKASIQKEKPSGRYFISLPYHFYAADYKYFEISEEMANFLQEKGLAYIREVEDAGWARDHSNPVNRLSELVEVLRKYEISIPSNYAHPDFTPWYELPELESPVVPPEKPVEIPEFRPRRPDESMEEYLKAKAEWEKQVKGYTEIKFEELEEPVKEQEEISYKTYAVLAEDEGDKAEEPVADLEKEISENTGFIEYHVVKGDTLSEIAARFGTTWQELMKYNSWIENPDLIYPCWTIKIPKKIEPFKEAETELKDRIDREWEETDEVCYVPLDEIEEEIDDSSKRVEKQIGESKKDYRTWWERIIEAPGDLIDKFVSGLVDRHDDEVEKIADTFDIVGGSIERFIEREGEVPQSFFEAFLGGTLGLNKEDRQALLALFAPLLHPMEFFTNMLIGTLGDIFMPSPLDVSGYTKDFEKWLEELTEEESKEFSKRLEKLS